MTMIKPCEVIKPAAVLITNIKATKEELVGLIERGVRDFDKVRRTMEDYIAFQKAADVLHGYDQIEQNKKEFRP